MALLGSGRELVFHVLGGMTEGVGIGWIRVGA